MHVPLPQLQRSADGRLSPAQLRSTDLVLSFDTVGDGRIDDFDPVGRSTLVLRTNRNRLKLLIRPIEDNRNR